MLVLGGVGEVPWTPGQPRVLPSGTVDLEALDPAAVELPAWYRPDPGRARDLAMVFVSIGEGGLRATRITNRRWAFSALGAAAAATLTTSDTVYCCLPLHHPSGTLVATGSALVGGARLALASRFEPQTLWDEVRRYGVTVVYYAGEMCRRLVDAPPALGEANNPVRLFAGSGLRPDVWRRLVDRFGPVGVLELYASTEANAVLANARGKKIGWVGRPLPGSPELAIAAWNFDDNAFQRDGAGHLVRARLDEPGMLLARIRPPGDALIDPARLLGDAFETGDLWFVTGDFFEVDAEGDHRFVDRAARMIRTRLGAVAARRIEDALYEVPGVALCIAGRQPDPDAAGAEIAVAVLQLQPGASLDLSSLLAALSAGVARLPEYARPRRLRIVDAIPVTDGFRPLSPPEPARPDQDGVYAWDARGQRYVAARGATADAAAAL